MQLHLQNSDNNDNRNTNDDNDNYSDDNNIKNDYSKNHYYNHTKLFKDDGKNATSKERPDCLADYFAKKQWGIDHDRDKSVRTTKLFEFMSNINTEKITMDELIDTVKLCKNNKSPGPD